MARRKAKAEMPVCPHCSQAFKSIVKFCNSCQDHFGMTAWTKDNDACDRCAAGLNDGYLERRKHRDARIVKALEDLKDEKNWGDDSVIVAFKAWVESPAYSKRFEERIRPVLNTSVCPRCKHSGAYHVGETCVAWDNDKDDDKCGCLMQEDRS